MQAVRNSGSRLLWSWAWPPTNRIVARVPAATIHTGAQQLQDAAAKQKVEKAAPAPAATPAPSSSSSRCQMKATAKGVTHIRVVVKGLGPGRLVICIQGLTMGGLEVISITDNTPIPHNGCRPRKARRL
ncbi:28S ribosomal protein S11, mitochondrial [Myotis lucifugus]|uniref:28S ribosomal protein S11, mitochondrial n=1 Tax=Myotis lucifugus TaxID=59463 RepID=UPI000CCC5237|nr:28S ribosomal protein S11, mitochondrial [Myotis lucifugus]